jgi:hypothetical protein
MVHGFKCSGQGPWHEPTQTPESDGDERAHLAFIECPVTAGDVHDAYCCPRRLQTSCMRVFQCVHVWYCARICLYARVYDLQHAREPLQNTCECVFGSSVCACACARVYVHSCVLWTCRPRVSVAHT